MVLDYFRHKIWCEEHREYGAWVSKKRLCCAAQSGVRTVSDRRRRRCALKCETVYSLVRENETVLEKLLQWLTTADYPSTCRHSQSSLFYGKWRAAARKRRWWPGRKIRSWRSNTVYCITSGGAGWLVLLGLSVTPGLQDGHHMKRSDLLERLEFRTSFR